MARSARTTNYDIDEGDSVLVRGKKGSYTGTVRFFGEVYAPSGGGATLFVGVELDTPHGRNDGVDHRTGKRYFSCKPKHGLFCQPHIITVIEKAKTTATVTAKAKFENSISQNMDSQGIFGSSSSAPLAKYDDNDTENEDIVELSTSKLQNHHNNKAINAQKQQPMITQKTKLKVIWSCNECQRECIPVREQSRCLCGHRLQDHPTKRPAESDKSVLARRNRGRYRKPLACCRDRCKCEKFYYVVAEGAWILRCRCKHKSTDHDPGPGRHKCKRPRCDCSGFDSPWVCNCDHPWSAHTQRTVKQKVLIVDGMEMPMNGDGIAGIGGLAREMGMAQAAAARPSGRVRPTVEAAD